MKSNSSNSDNNNLINISSQSNKIQELRIIGYKESPTKLPNNFVLKCSRKKTVNKVSLLKEFRINRFNLKSYEGQVYKTLSKKYNSSPNKYNILCINQLINNVPCRLVSKFKETMIVGYIDEFLKRKYSFKECKERIPKFYLYYKHYSIFFGVPFFVNNSFNVMLQKNGEKKARIYYKNHYQNGESLDEGNENIGFAESLSDESDTEDKEQNNNPNIFRSEIKENIDNVTVMTTINTSENNTINLGLNNEKLEAIKEELLYAYLLGDIVTNPKVNL